MAATNWTIIKRNKATNQIVIFNLEAKWTYKIAIGIATELNNDEINELVCIIETNKIMLKDDKKRFKQTKYLSDNKTFTTFKEMKTYV